MARESIGDAVWKIEEGVIVGLKRTPEGLARTITITTKGRVLDFAVRPTEDDRGMNYVGGGIAVEHEGFGSATDFDGDVQVDQIILIAPVRRMRRSHFGSASVLSWPSRWEKAASNSNPTAGL